MSQRALLVALILVATAAFVLGTSIERNSEDDHHVDSPPTVESGREGSETQAEHDEGAEAAHVEAGAEGEEAEPSEELRPLGIDVEAAPFVALAAVGSLLLALGVWMRPRWLALLLATAAAMIAFAALDVREVFHQSDESNTGLALLAALVAGAHLCAATVAVLMARSAERPTA